MFFESDVQPPTPEPFRSQVADAKEIVEACLEGQARAVEIRVAGDHFAFPVGSEHLEIISVRIVGHSENGQLEFVPEVPLKPT